MKVREGACTKANIIVQFRVTPKIADLIENKQEALGYTTRSAMIRDMLLKDDLAMHNKLNEILNIVKEIKHGKK